MQKNQKNIGFNKASKTKIFHAVDSKVKKIKTQNRKTHQQMCFPHMIK